jgi:CheY-like chemotaxis protein
VALVQFAVADTGIGIGDAERARLFQPFEQADSSASRRYGGTGLGLAISRNLARLMGGEIEVDCAPGAGCSFTLRLPLPVTTPQLPGPAVDAAVTTQRRLAGLRLLAAEDMEINRLILEDLLIHEGAHVTFAEDGQQALDRLEEAGVSAFDAVLMDVQMPGMNGLDATRRLREIAPALPVIGLTAHAFAEGARQVPRRRHGGARYQAHRYGAAGGGDPAPRAASFREAGSGGAPASARADAGRLTASAVRPFGNCYGGPGRLAGLAGAVFGS